MWVQADYLQVVKEIVLSNCKQEISLELEEEFKRIAQKCDDALNSHH